MLINQARKEKKKNDILIELPPREPDRGFWQDGSASFQLLTTVFLVVTLGYILNLILAGACCVL